MNKLLEDANKFMRQSDWKMLAMLKCCLFALGFMFGACTQDKYRRTATSIATGIFAGIYIFLMSKFNEIVDQEDE